jgi:hypothetical protein
MDASLHRDSKNPLSPVTVEPGPMSLPAHQQLFRQGLMLADQLVPSDEQDSLSESTIDIDFDESEDITVLQTLVDSSLEASSQHPHPHPTPPQSDAQIWTVPERTLPTL